MGRIRVWGPRKSLGVEIFEGLELRFSWDSVCEISVDLALEIPGDSWCGVWVGSGFGVSENAGCAVLEELGVEASGDSVWKFSQVSFWGSQMVLDISFLRVSWRCPGTLVLRVLVS